MADNRWERERKEAYTRIESPRPGVMTPLSQDLLEVRTDPKVIASSRGGTASSPPSNEN